MIVGTKTVNGIKITGQSKHFLERYFGTMSNPTDNKKKPRSGVSIKNIKEALYLGKCTNPKFNFDKKGNQKYNADGTKMRSQLFITKKCAISVNPDTGRLVQCNPKS